MLQAADSSEEEEDNNEYDLDDKFIAQEGEDEEDEDDEGIGGERRKKRHKRRREKSPELDDEDYQLLEDNQVTVSIPWFTTRGFPTAKLSCSVPNCTFLSVLGIFSLKDVLAPFVKCYWQVALPSVSRRQA